MTPADVGSAFLTRGVVQRMSLSTGTKSLLTEALSWAAVAMIGVYVVTHYDEVKALTASTLGITMPSQMAAAETDAQAETETYSGGTVELKASANGHFHTAAEVNGREIEVMVDTGASMVALTEEDAERAGIYLKNSDFTHSVSTANGIARVAPVTIGRLTIGDITVRNVEAAVCERGKLTTTLLGMSFLSRLDRVDMRSGVLVLQD